MTPVAVQSSCAPGSRSFSRADIVSLGQAGRPWEFLPLAARALDLAPADAGIRFLAAANLARVGLPSFARAQLDLLPPEVRTDAAVAGLARDLDSAPPDRVSPDALRAALTANLALLREAGVSDLPDPSSWSRALDAWVVCRSSSGEFVRAPGLSSPLSAWVGLIDATGHARRVIGQLPAAADGFPAPVVIDGVDPCRVLLECLAARPATSTGYRSPITVVETDARAFLWSMACTDLRPLGDLDRVSFFVGPGAVERFEATLMARLEFQVSGYCIPSRPGAGTPALRDAYQRVCDAQQHLTATLADRVATLYAGRDASSWSARYADAARAGPPLRILIPTARYSTYIKHASADLADAARRAGHEPRVLIEPDDRTRFARAAYLRQIAEFQPDLVVLVNYPRAAMRDVFPAQVPYVCWLQDPMPHLFDPAIGAAQTGLDFLAGHLFPELFEKFSYPAERVVPAPVVASASKFHAGAPSAELRARHECEIAFVSHHAQTPEQLLATLLSQAGADPRVRGALEGILPAVRTAVDECCRVPPHQALAQHVRAHLERALGHADDRTLTGVLRHYALPLADRMFRHQAVAWAHDLCARRSWRLHLYGRGWDTHPKFGACARRELDHGEELRASYASARVHLHVSLGTLVHQRVLECVLSGGLPLCRLHRDALAGFKTRAQLACAALGPPHAQDEARELAGWRIADCPEAMAMTAQLQRLAPAVGDASGHAGTDPEYCWVHRKRLESQRRLGPVIDARHDAMWLLGDLAETTFWSAATLESLVERAIDRPAWRENLLWGIRPRVVESLTHDAFLGRLLESIRGTLSASPAPGHDEVSPAAGAPPASATGFR